MSRLIVPTLSPGMLIGTGGDHGGSAKYKCVVEGDFAKALALTNSAPDWDERQIFDVDQVGRPFRLFPTPEEVAEFFGPLFFAWKQGDHIVMTVDVETSGEHQLACKLLCVGVGYQITPYVGGTTPTVPAPGPERLMCIPFHHQGGARYWSPEHEQAVRYFLGWALANVDITKNFHNGGFDTVVLGAHGFPVNGWREDTMHLAHVTDSELPLNLGFVASRHTQGRFWKDDVKGIGGWVDMDPTTLRSYNLRDILSTMRIRVPLFQEAQQLGVLDVYRTELQCAQIMARATVRGMFIDRERRDSTAIDPKTNKPIGLGPQLDMQMNRALWDLRQVAGAGFEPNKPEQLRWLLFDKLKFPVVKQTDSGYPSTDKEALMLLDVVSETDEQRAALRNISLFRQGQKFRSTFIDGLTELADGGFHPSWSIRTVSGRFTSSPNAQNLPMLIKKIFRSRPGRKLVGIDLSQAELRLMGYYANEPTLLEMYSKDINVHTVNASLLFHVQCPPTMKDHINPQTEAYIRQALKTYLGMQPGDYDSFPVVPDKKWKSVRTLAKVGEFSQIYGAVPETVHSMLRSKRDPDTLNLMFPGLPLGEIQALSVVWRTKLRRGVVTYWDKIQAAIRGTGFARCPISGRVRRFRAGYNRNEMLNYNIQTGVASWMNKCLIVIQKQFDDETGGDCQVIQQVHDALTADAPDWYAQRAGEVMQTVCSSPFDIEPTGLFKNAIGTHYGARVPADAAMINDYLDKT